MKKHVLNFIQRGLVGATFGPLVLAIIYAILGATDTISSLSVNEVVLGIISISVMAFIAGGITMVYEVENLPLISAILIHALSLYIDYAIMYLINGWIGDGIVPFLVFTAIFFIGFAVIWGFIYLVTRKKTKALNQTLLKKQ